MLDARPNKAGEHPIRVSICIRRVRLQTSIGFSVAKDKWVAAMPDSPRKEKEVKSMHYVIPNTVNSVGMKGNEMNAKLLKIKTHFDEYERTLERLPTKDDLSSELDIALNRKELKQEIEIVGSAAITIQDRLKEFVREQSIACQWAYATLQAWKTFSNHLSKFGKRVTFDDFNEDGLNKFIRFLRVKQNLEEKTVQKQYNNLKWFLNWALRKGYYSDNTVNTYRPKFKVLEKPVIFLRKEELLHLYKYKVPANGTKVKLKDAEGNELDATGDVKYKGIKFNYNEVKEMLEKGSTIDILDEQDTVLHTITKEESECSILFESKVNNIKIRINEVAVNKTLTVELIKTIDKSNYTAEEFSKIEILESLVDVKVKYVGFDFPV